MTRFFTIFFLYCALACCAILPAYAVDGSWSGFHLRDVNGPVKAIAQGPDGQIYIGGTFTEVGGIAAANIACWYNGTWQALGSGATGGTQPAVEALVIGANGHLYAGGQFTSAGGKVVNNIAEWDGTQWLPMGSGANGKVTSLAIGSNTELYAGGQFTTIGSKSASRVARWRNGQWSALGTGIQGGDIAVEALHFSNGTLYIGGNFTNAGDAAVNNIAEWNGQNWQALGVGIPEYTATVYHITTINDTLYATGAFALPGEITTANVRAWDGTTWTGRGYFNGPVYTLSTGSSGLIAAGNFSEASSGAAASTMAPAASIAATSGAGWSAIRQGITGTVYTLLHSNTNLFAGGDFSIVSGMVTHNIARWDDQNWLPITPIPSNSINGSIRTIVVAPNGDMYVGGLFTTAGSTTANSIARWNGQQWFSLGTGVNGTVHALAVDSKGVVYAGGDFSMAGNTAANAVARWNGKKWETLNTSASFTRVYAMAVNEAGIVYAGGIFSEIGSTAANNVARWTGTEWRTMNSGVDGAIYAMTYRNGRLFIGGDFEATASGELSGVSEWDGAQWKPLRNGVDGTVHALALAPNGRLYAGGNFTIPTRSIVNIGMWDGSEWQKLGAGTNHEVLALAVDSAGTVYTTGLFTMAGGTNAEKIAAWSAGAWSSLSTGIAGTARVLAVSQTTIFAGGEFTAAGSQPAHNLAAWTPCTISAAISANGSATFCKGGSVELSVQGNFTSYLWNTGETTATITVTQPGSYTVTVRNTTGCSAVAPPFVVRVDSVALKLAAAAELCAGDSVRLAASGATQYQWSPAEGLSCTDCATPYAKPSQNTVYTVLATSAEGCTTTATVAVTVKPAPSKPTINKQGDNLLQCSTPASSYSWLRDGLPIPGAEQSSYTVPDGAQGWFAVRITNDEGCTALSDSLYVNLTTSVAEISTAPFVAISGENRFYTVSCRPQVRTPLTLVVADLVGRTVLELQQPEAESYTIPIDMRGVTPGVYIVQLSVGNARYARALIVR